MTVESAQHRRRGDLTSDLGRLMRMIEIREVEETIQSLYSAGEIRGSTHLYSGQEAVGVGLGSVAPLGDTVACTYRGHGIALALGMEPSAVIGEVCGRSTGCVGGLGGSMHLCDPSIGLLPTFAIVGAQLPVAVGVALASAYRSADSIAWAVLGDGATNIGAFHESLNMASVMGLPVVFVIENNLYGEYSPLRRTTPLDDLFRRGEAYGMRAAAVDGQDVDAVADALAEARNHAAAGHGPSLVEAKTYRYSGHSRSDPGLYRSEEEVQSWVRRDPIAILAERMWPEGHAERLTEVVEQVRAEVVAATDYALRPLPPIDKAEMLRHITG